MKSTTLKCKYCKTTFTGNQRIYDEHIQTCLKNPQNKTCATCKYVRNCKYKDGYANKINCLKHEQK